MQDRHAQGRKRKAPDIDDSNPFLQALQQRISAETAVLDTLEEDIDGAGTDDEQPVQPRTGPIADQDASQDDGHELPAHAHAGHAADAAHAAAAGLHGRAKRERDKRRKARKKDAGSFSLALIAEDMAAFVVSSSAEGPLELPRFSKMQRLQVRAMAALYGLEPRACGRAGQSLFRTQRSGPLTPDGQAQASGPQPRLWLLLLQ